ncbi:hypothetical protein HY623_02160 [Candidatus Uhrbacteria bacterium]|nr:hypothetical protein [Candidatus Uhrbacteria bacterium]
MSEEKQSARWYVAATHWLTGGVVPSFILYFIMVAVLRLGFGENIERGVDLLAFVYLLLMPLVYWLGAMYSARYVNKKYIITDSGEVAKLATLYLVVVGGGYRIFQMIAGSEFTVEHASFVLAVIAFYIASKKYIHSSGAVVQQGVRQ